jgi:hypothetical protein
MNNEKKTWDLNLVLTTGRSMGNFFGTKEEAIEVAWRRSGQHIPSVCRQCEREITGDIEPDAVVISSGDETIEDGLQQNEIAALRELASLLLKTGRRMFLALFDVSLCNGVLLEQTVRDVQSALNFAGVPLSPDVEAMRNKLLAELEDET